MRRLPSSPRCSTRARNDDLFSRSTSRATTGIVRARARIGLRNFVYNIRHFVQLDRLAAAVT
jgi:hypothetical protein